jgi:hypothetical protein
VLHHEKEKNSQRRELMRSTRARPALLLHALAVLSATLVLAPGATGAGKPVAWGCGFDSGQCSVPTNLTGVTAVAAALGHSMALKSDGTVIAWGCRFNDHGQCGVPSGLTGVTAIAAGSYHSLAVKSDGTVVAWGCGGVTNSGQCSVPGGLVGVTAIAAGNGSSLALKSDGTVVSWGCAGGLSGQCNVPAGLSDVTAIVVAQAQSLASKSDGTVTAWGCGIFFGNYGQCTVPGDLSGATGVAAGYFHSLAVKGDGTVVAWGCGMGFDYGQCSVPGGLSHVNAISAGDYHSLALVELPNQTITFGPLANKTYHDPDFNVSATTSSGLPVSFAASGNCTVAVATVRLTGAGSCTITASQPGDSNYNPAPSVSQSFAIAKASQSILFPPLENRPYGSRFIVTATASSGLPVSFAASGGCTVSGSTVRLTGTGTCTITASQAGDANYTAAAPVSRTLRILGATCRVPNVVGKRLAAAKRLLVQRHCRTGKVGHAYSRKRKKGIVISQNRRPGKVLPARSKINLVVSRGRRR